MKDKKNTGHFNPIETVKRKPATEQDLDEVSASFLRFEDMDEDSFQHFEEERLEGNREDE